MYLKAVNINGFKSFSENTNIDFTNKVNVVVGPNGSGKSNVVDAISWVLGTQSPATLRTNKMEDGIFAGTAKLSQKGFAEVNLNFEVDADKFNGTDEISIGRKLYRDGQSEYFMNGLNCRLLDIQEFLSDVGIGKQQHTIISQGQIAEILNSKPEDHRITIEEAAGILPFKLKKDKALRRIESGEKEIKRAKDVIREIKKQLKPLKEQAEQATLHAESVNKLKELKITFNILNYQKFSNKNKIINQELIKINEELDNLSNSIKNQKELKNKIHNNLGENISLGSLYKDYSNKILNNAEKIKNIVQISNERIDNIERSQTKYIQEKENNKNKILDNSNLVSSLSSQLILKKNILTEKSNKLEILNTELLDVIKKQSLNLGTINQNRDDITNIYKQRGLISDKFDNIFTDKSLNNFFFLKFIKEIYPESKIINCKRNILASIMSIFQNHLTELAWVHNLDNIFKYFDNYFKTIDVYEKLNPNSIYHLDYEKLVNNPIEESKKLMKFCELPWHKKCLEFYKRQDLFSKTASNVQIRQAVYKHSLDKYLPYKKMLDNYGKKYSWFN